METTDFETKKEIYVDLAKNGAKFRGKSTWMFEHDGSEYEVTAVRKNGRTRVSMKKV